MSEIFHKKEVAIEVSATCSFMDVPGGLSDSIYHVETKTIRLNYIALDQWFDGQFTKGPEEFEKIGEWYNYRDERHEARKNCDKKIRHALGYDDWDSCAVTQVLSEIFTAVAMEEITK